LTEEVCFSVATGVVTGISDIFPQLGHFTRLLLKLQVAEHRLHS